MQRDHAGWAFVAVAMAGLATAVGGYGFRASGIDHTEGALLVVVSTTLLSGAALALALTPRSASRPRWTLWLAAAADILASAFAAWLLHAWLLLGLLALALVAGTALALPARPPGRRWSRAAGAHGLLFVAGLSLAAPFALTPAAPAYAPLPPAEDGQAWATFNGDLMAQKASAAGQITPRNVQRLKVAWALHTGDVSAGDDGRPASSWGATPLFVNNAVYVSTPFDRIFSIEPDTGKVKWIYDSRTPLAAPSGGGLKSRGVAYWQAQSPRSGELCGKIVYLGALDGRLHAVDADRGVRCPGFGQGGVVDLNRWNSVNPKWRLSILQPPTVYKDTLFVGWTGVDWANAVDPPGTVFALDARTGALKWTFHALPASAYGATGAANVWASMSVDPETGVLYLPVSSPSPDFYGGGRKAPLPLANSVTAVDSRTGRILWSRQLVHHDLWDYDVDSAPVLVDLHRGGQVKAALVQATKQGFLFVLDRRTGEPIFPIEERPVPASDVPGEAASPTQPYVRTPQPVSADRWPGVFALADALSFGECSRALGALRYSGRFTPPSLGAGALVYPGAAGGVEWGGGAVDPATQTYVVNSSSMPVIVQLLARGDYDSRPRNYSKSDYYPMSGSPYGVRQNLFWNRLHMPCSKPPYGQLSAYDLNTGALLWRRPFGVIQRWGFYMPPSWGSVTIGGPLVTRTGLVFIGASMDSRVRAMDLRTGRELWSAQVDAPAVAIPATYAYRGRQYVLFTAGGNSLMSNRLGDQLVAFSLQ
jgi:quinoprotein glucose dehydrogenase